MPIALLAISLPALGAGKACEIGQPAKTPQHWQQAEDAALLTRWCRVAQLSGFHRMDVDKYRDKGWLSVAKASEQALAACDQERIQLATLLAARGLAPPDCP
ncbi:hypothetical protein [Ferrimonas balearica]|uniref:hypothetical protein n=1 Tax=Ferrimonas balearica TaxID=44012 RepID=UPI001C9A2B81|nr:hypothetical protein [Ferrimonas balearica]MBY5993386.1 hypothetical protein [Ferrimonas balearica]